MGKRETIILINFEIERALREPTYSKTRATNIQKALDALAQSRQTHDQRLVNFFENASLGFLLRK